ncbi:Fe(2+) transporter permease subunit FeoB [Pleomorphomonas sp. NRK KF1]|uniref:Fe(2+) transporter permease subunit FeoB n=1 Tax=Pleomorphomonas sp. NRK KF1 TaxID=2943000 RepID=UPI002043D12F|nr:Fe(2+) transporter permease subunit FeoB [Pleomorphomonas sp. NRK KF1]MCM5554553.1 Fe(2+) transporter permease subunit FeoB [Pleomorphomonas sp. NRK KF1]
MMVAEKPLVVAVVGNPNCGKSTLFNALTGATQKVGNWPGVTVEKRVGRFIFEGQSVDVVDLPGVYLIGSADAGSQDERVARDFVMSGEADLVLNIVDASNLERNLYLTTQLIELGVPMLVVLNMMDMAKADGVEIDIDELSKRLGCPVIPTVATRGLGRHQHAHHHGHHHGHGRRRAIKSAIVEAARAGQRPVARPEQDPAVVAAISTLVPLVADGALVAKADPAWVALKLIEGDTLAEAIAGPSLAGDVASARAAIEAATGEDADIVIADGRYRFIGELMTGVFRRTQRLSASMSQMIDRIVLNRVLGVPIFLFAMYLMFLFTISVGGAFIDFFDQAFGAVFVDSFGELLASIGTPPIVEAALVGFGSGIQTVSTFVPIIACLFLFLSFLEDSGYMARAAFVMDRAMRAIGLPGKSFVPLIVGFGCNVPAIMATRTLESRRDRIMTSLMAPFMSCGARLPVFALFAAAFFPVSGQNIVFGLYIVGLAFAVLTGLVLKSTLLDGEPTRFVMELPPYHIPTIRSVIVQAWQRLREFILRAGQVIVPIVMVLSFLSAIGTDGSVDRDNTRGSVLAVVSQELVPVFEPMGVTRDNWPAAVGLFTGIFAKEAVIGTLNALYEQVGTEGAAPAATEGAVATEEEVGLGGKLLDALATIPENLGALGGSLVDPLGINVGYVDDSAAAAEELEVDGSVFGAMQSHFGGTAAAFSYMLLILLYTPCVAALGAMRHEIGGRWTAFATVWTTAIGYLAAVSFYQAATFAAHPASSTRWLLAAAIIFAVGIAAMWMAGRTRGRSLAAQPAE